MQYCFVHRIKLFTLFHVVLIAGFTSTAVTPAAHASTSTTSSSGLLTKLATFAKTTASDLSDVGRQLFNGGLRLASGFQSVCCPNYGCYNTAAEVFGLEPTVHHSHPSNSRANCDVQVSLIFNRRHNSAAAPPTAAANNEQNRQYYEYSDDIVINVEASPAEIDRWLTNVAGFDAVRRQRTVFLFPGYTNRAREDFYTNLRDAVLEYGDFNVFRVDFSSRVLRPYVENRVVAAKVASFIVRLVQVYGLNVTTQLHFIGFSLGSHLAGYTAATLTRLLMLPPTGDGSHNEDRNSLCADYDYNDYPQQTDNTVDLSLITTTPQTASAGALCPQRNPPQFVWKITGLDPGPPQFHKARREGRLDTTDAQFVEVYHTDAGGLGDGVAIGHVDFYFNSGRALQPGCNESVLSAATATFDVGSVYAGREVLGCSHIRAVRLYAEIIRKSLGAAGDGSAHTTAQSLPECKFIAYSCESYEDYLRGTCTGCANADFEGAPPKCVELSFNTHRHSVGLAPFDTAKLAISDPPRTYHLLTTSANGFCAFNLVFSFEFLGPVSANDGQNAAVSDTVQAVSALMTLKLIPRKNINRNLLNYVEAGQTARPIQLIGYNSSYSTAQKLYKYVVASALPTHQIDSVEILWRKSAQLPYAERIRRKASKWLRGIFGRSNETDDVMNAVSVANVRLADNAQRESDSSTRARSRDELVTLDENIPKVISFLQ